MKLNKFAISLSYNFKAWITLLGILALVVFHSNATISSSTTVGIPTVNRLNSTSLAIILLLDFHIFQYAQVT